MPASAGALLAQTTAFASLDVFSFDRSADVLLVLIIGGTGYLYGGLIGAVVFKLHAGLARRSDAAVLAVLDRPDAGRHRAGRPRAHGALDVAAARLGDAAGERMRGRRRTVEG